VRFGLILPNFGPLAAAPDGVSNLVRVARHAEELGFEIGWLGDHIALPRRLSHPYPYSRTGQYEYVPLDAPYYEALTALAYLAASTERIRLGPGVLVLPYRHPVLAAKMVSTLDLLSRGRITLGVGIGWSQQEVALLGGTWKRRGAYAEECIRAMRELWTSRDPEFRGEFVEFSGIAFEPKPVQNPIPIVLGGGGERAIRRVVELADGWFAAPVERDDFARDYALLRRLADEAGRPLEEIPIEVIPTPPTSVTEFADEVAFYSGTYGVDRFTGFVPFWADGLDNVLRVMDEFAARLM
jgi:probable F420-dependent oxidoreductase